jgi:hypothetical protein
MLTFPRHISQALYPLDMSCFRHFKTTIKKEKNNAMIINRFEKPKKIKLVAWVDTTLDKTLSKKNQI